MDYYEGNLLADDSFDIYEFYKDIDDNQKDKNGKYIIVDIEGDILKFEIIEMREDTLTLMHLPRGNILKYEKL